MSRVVVYGGAGHTARFVARELLARGLEVGLAGRDPAKLRAAAEALGVSWQEALVDDAPSLQAALAGAVAVVNCAGPFAESAPALIAAAARAGIHALDVTAEALVARDTLEQLAGVRSGPVVMPAVGFFGALGSLLAAAVAGGWPDAEGVTLALALSSWHPTRGTRLAGARRAGRRVRWREGRLEVLPPAPPPRSTRTFGAPFGEQEVVGEVTTVDALTLPRHLRLRTLEYLLNAAPLAQLADPASPGPEATDASGRSGQQFRLEVEVRRGGEVRTGACAGRDIYAVTAPLVGEALTRVLAGQVRRGGCLVAGEAFEAAGFLRSLAPAHLALELPGRA